MSPRIPTVRTGDAGPLVRLAYRWSRHRFGEVPEPFAVLAHHRGLFWTTALTESLVERLATALPAALRDLAVARVATRIGCSWCVDFGSMLARRSGLDVEHLRRTIADDAMADPAFTDLERLALRYADAMTAQPPAVPEDLVAALDAALGHRGLVELTHAVALENMRARTYSALGVHDQGFAAECPVPPR